MYRPIALAGFTLALAGCPGNSVTFEGIEMTPYFSFDGERTWEFVSTDQSLPHVLVGVLNSEPELVNESVTRIYTIDFHKDCLREENCVEDEYVRTMRWSSDATYGTQIWGYELASGESIDFDPPIVVTPARFRRENSVTTETGGVTWTSTFAAIEPCPVQWNVDWDECIRLELDDGDGDLTSGSPISGSYWAVVGFNVVAVEWPGESGRWELLRHVYEG